MAKIIWQSEYFCGNRISPYGLEHGRVDYATLAKSFDAVLANEIIPATWEIGYWEIDNGSESYFVNDDGDEISMEEYEENGGEEIFYDIYQYYIISSNGASILRDYTDEIVWYNEKLDLYVWGVTHYGTSWDYVLTGIRVKLGGETK